jgi:hypothetical protein
MEFIMREFGMGMIQVGLQPTDAWYTIYGQGPQVLAGGVTETLERMYETAATSSECFEPSSSRHAVSLRARAPLLWFACLPKTSLRSSIGMG